MAVNQLLKVKALKLRKSGKSYNFISDNLKIPKSTLVYWFKDLGWSKKIKESLQERNRVRSRRTIKILHKTRQLKLKERYRTSLLDADKEFKIHQNNLLFISGILIYWGEGDKVFKNGIVRISNIDYKMVHSFYLFLRDICRIPEEKIRFWLLLYPDLEENKCIDFWSKKIGVSRKQFFKSTTIIGRHKRNKVSSGVCEILVSDKFFKAKILRWLDLLADKILCYNQGQIKRV